MSTSEEIFAPILSGLSDIRASIKEKNDREREREELEMKARMKAAELKLKEADLESKDYYRGQASSARWASVQTQKDRVALARGEIERKNQAREEFAQYILDNGSEYYLDPEAEALSIRAGNVPKKPTTIDAVLAPQVQYLLEQQKEAIKNGAPIEVIDELSNRVEGLAKTRNLFKASTKANSDSSQKFFSGLSSEEKLAFKDALSAISDDLDELGLSKEMKIEIARASLNAEGGDGNLFVPKVDGDGKFEGLGDLVAQGEFAPLFDFMEAINNPSLKADDIKEILSKLDNDDYYGKFSSILKGPSAQVLVGKRMKEAIEAEGAKLNLSKEDIFEQKSQAAKELEEIFKSFKKNRASKDRLKK